MVPFWLVLLGKTYSKLRNMEKGFRNCSSFRDFEEADEVFMTGNMTKITPVTAFEDKNYQVGSIAKPRELYWDWYALRHFDYVIVPFRYQVYMPAPTIITAPIIKLYWYSVKNNAKAS